MLEHGAIRRRVVVAAVCLTTLVSAQAASTQLFEAPWLGYDATVYPQGYRPWAARAADFNGDGYADLAVVSWYSNTRVTILLADGAGGYRSPTYYPMTLGGLDLEVADFDRDGDVDVVVTNTGQVWEGNTVTLLRNAGDGTFSFAGQFSAGKGPTGITVADFNGDGWTDLAVAHDEYISYAASMGVLLNDRNGGFAAAVIYSLPQGTYKIASGDLDGDSDADLAVAHHTGVVAVVRNDGGVFTLATTLGGSADSTNYIPTVSIADVDRDNDRDILYSATNVGFGFNNGAIVLYRNNGNATFAAGEYLAMVPGAQGATDIEVADVTGDTWPDLLATTESSQIWCLLPGDGQGGFLAAREYRATHAPLAVLASDVNGDARLDVTIVGRDSLEAVIYVNPGQAEFVQPPLIEMVSPAMAPSSASNLATGDIDRDGDLDLVVGWQENFGSLYGIGLRRNHGDGTFAPPESLPMSILPVRVQLRDLNADGRLDLLWADDDWPARFHVRFNDGSGKFNGPTYDGPVTSNIITALDAFDFNHDGLPDIVVNGDYGFVGVAQNFGSGAFGGYSWHAVDGGVSAVAAGDFNADQKLDLLTNSGVQGYAELSLGNGNLTFQPAVTLETGRDIRAFAVGDLDKDGQLDFVGHFNLDEKGLSVRRGRGDGTFFAAVNYHGVYFFDDNESSVVLADADGDGHLDAFIGGGWAQEFAFWRGRGDGAFAQAVRYGAGWDVRDLAVGDFTGDAQPDVALLANAYAAGGWYYPAVVLIRGVGAATPGDLNCDRKRDFFDINPFVLLLSDPGAWQAQYPGCPIANGDINKDGKVDFFDINPFVALLVGG